MASKSHASIMEIDSLVVDLNIPAMQTDPRNCRHFSIREYVSQMREKNKNACEPFASYEELPPMIVPNYKYWRCEGQDRCELVCDGHCASIFSSCEAAIKSRLPEIEISGDVLPIGSGDAKEIIPDMEIDCTDSPRPHIHETVHPMELSEPEILPPKESHNATGGSVSAADEPEGAGLVVSTRSHTAHLEENESPSSDSERTLDGYSNLRRKPRRHRILTDLMSDMEATSQEAPAPIECALSHIREANDKSREAECLMEASRQHNDRRAAIGAADQGQLTLSQLENRLKFFINSSENRQYPISASGSHPSKGATSAWLSKNKNIPFGSNAYSAESQYKGRTISDLKGDEMNVQHTKFVEAKDNPFWKTSSDSIQAMNLLKLMNKGTLSNANADQSKFRGQTSSGFDGNSSSRPLSFSSCFTDYMSQRASQSNSALSQNYEKPRYWGSPILLGVGHSNTYLRSTDRSIFNQQTYSGFVDLQAIDIHSTPIPVCRTLQVEECMFNQNPADFSTPEVGNQYTIDGKDLMI